MDHLNKLLQDDQNFEKLLLAITNKDQQHIGSCGSGGGGGGGGGDCGSCQIG
jgi:hypothetical protein